MLGDIQFRLSHYYIYMCIPQILIILAIANNYSLTEVEVASGGYFPSRKAVR